MFEKSFFLIAETLEVNGTDDTDLQLNTLIGTWFNLMLITCLGSLVCQGD